MRSLLSVFALAALWALAPLAAGAQRPFTVQDSIAFSVFLSPHGWYKSTAEVMFSPDGSRFVTATMRGDLASDKREVTLWVFGASEVRGHLEASGGAAFAGARPLLRWSSASNREPLSHWRWAEDSRSLLLLASDDDGARRLYRLDLEGRMTALSRADQDVSRYDERNGHIAYLAHPPVRADDLYQAGGPALPDIEVGTGSNLLPLLFPNWMAAQFDASEDELWTVRNGKAEPVGGARSEGAVKLKDARLAIAPDGRSAVVTQFARRVPKSWERYAPLIDLPGLRFVADTPETEGTSDHYRPQQYMLIDLSSGETSLLVDAPIEMGANRLSDVGAEWSDDSEQVALPGVYPPFAGSEAAMARIYPCEIMVVTVEDRQWSCTQNAKPADVEAVGYGDRLQMIDLRWGGGTSELVATYAAPNAPTQRETSVSTRAPTGWTTRRSPRTVQADALAIQIRQSLSDPPVLAVEDRAGEWQPLLDPNPQLADLALGEAALYRWRDADGNAWEGALVKPPGFEAGRRYPLVIQTHNLDRGKFLLDGPSSTGFAAQALAGRGMLVLQVDEIRKNVGTPAESATGAAGYRGAIKQLAQEGLVDPDRVGIVTWSHMGPYALQGLVEEPHAYAAATFAEASFNSYVEYLINIDYMGTAREKMFRAQVGPKPFGEGLNTWVAQSAGFQTHRVCTPVLFQSNSPPALVYGWDAYATLRAQDKPVELLYIRNGDHSLVKPAQRLAEQGMNVDWLDYWLNGRKDHDPAKIGQYKRWDAMRSAPRGEDCEQK